MQQGAHLVAALLAQKLDLPALEQDFSAAGYQLGSHLYGFSAPLLASPYTLKDLQIHLNSQRSQNSSNNRQVQLLCGFDRGATIGLIIGKIDVPALLTEFSTYFQPGTLVYSTQCRNLATLCAELWAVRNAYTVAPYTVSQARISHVNELLAERVMIGDLQAQQTLRSRFIELYTPKYTELSRTFALFLTSGRSIESTARELNVHPNTVRYRLRRVSILCGIDPLNAADATLCYLGDLLARLPNFLLNDPPSLSPLEIRPTDPFVSRQANASVQ